MESRGSFGDFLRDRGRAESAALRALREIVAGADGFGRVSRYRLSPAAEESLAPLEDAGFIELHGPHSLDDPVHASDDWLVVRVAPRLLAEFEGTADTNALDRLLAALDEFLAARPSTGVALREDVSSDAEEHPIASTDAAPAPVPDLHERASIGPDSHGDGGILAPGADGDGVADAVTAAAPAVLAQAIEYGASTLAARGLVKVYRKRRVVNEVDLDLRQGEIVGLLGPNGAGKTTTFYMVVGLIQPDRGTVFLEKEEVTDVPMFRRARRGIGYLAQEPSIFRKLTVEENILAVLQMLGLRRAKQRERLETLLDELGIKHLRYTKAYALSGGERRRLEITRALVGNPKFMLLDEPFAGVDPIAVHDIQQIVADLRRRGIGVLISDHNVEQTLDIVDRAYIMYDGRVRVSGTVSELVWNDEVAEIYLGPTLTARMRQRYPHPTKEAG